MTPPSRCSPTSRASSTITSSSSSRRSPIRRSIVSSRRDHHLLRDPPRLRGQPAQTRNPPRAVSVELKYPILTNEEFAKIRRTDLPRPQDRRAPDSLPRRPRREGPGEVDGRTLHDGPAATSRKTRANVLILSDRGVTKEFAPIPALLAVAGLHHYLIREGLRTRVSLVIETGDAREGAHFSLLIGYGASAINPLRRLRVDRTASFRKVCSPALTTRKPA